MTLTGSCDKHNFITPQLQQGNIPKASIHRDNIPPIKDKCLIQETVKTKQSEQAQNICELCRNKGHYDYQCQFATDFLQRTQKAFQRSHYMHVTNND